ncbi:MAG TPA: ShlB/FhaC/HecB family hemolysin secretion/activation protein [Gemmatimonadaceae bacterium]|nr:ShlB/FhaC/HecB family hemolysin secretion/activation protein [Gemmatimonadaceae bacterium]
MFVLLGAALALNFQATQPDPAHRRLPVVRDSAADTASSSRRRHQGRRKPVTAELLATAYKDPAARSTLLRARVARLTQDSALVAYDAMSYQRVSVGLGFGRIGRDRLLFRHEAASRVRWRQGVGAWVDVKGSRSAMPMASGSGAGVKVELDDEMTDPDMMGEIPYYPGYEPMLIGGDLARAQVDETEIVHPIAEGAEAYYTYETGDSLSIKLPDGKVIRLRELKFRPRQPKWNLAVGSLWFDVQSGQLVRAAYRLSVPIDIWQVATEDDPKSMDDVPVWVKPMITPMKAEVSAVAVEYGLHEGRFWLPRLQLAEGSAQVSFMHVPFKLENSFKYTSVNGTDTLPTIRLAGATQDPPDSLSGRELEEWRDSVREARRARMRAERDSVRRGLKQRSAMVNQCDTSDARLMTQRRFDGALRVATRIPCDTLSLVNSPDLPKSIYDPGEELFGGKELEALKTEALSMTAQAPFSFRMHFLPPPTIAYGPSMMRYNRVEGFSAGISAAQELGGGYTVTALGRLGLADLQPNVELTGARTNLTKTIRVSGYNHLVSASDWGRPLSFGSSFSALMFGRDEGFYYRASGAELSGTREAGIEGGTRIDWRAFAEWQHSAIVETNFAVNGADFPPNLVAERRSFYGVGLRLNDQRGLDPQGFRVFSDLRLEAAKGDSMYGRAALDVTMSHGFGLLAGALTVAGGSSIGSLPPQRQWYLGGSQTVRGQSPDTAQTGNAFWLTRAELGESGAGVRPAVFADLGWVGDRNKLRDVGRPMSGVGAGVSFLDGLFRFDVARGLYPRKQFRVDLYLESKF